MATQLLRAADNLRLRDGQGRCAFRPNYEYDSDRPDQLSHEPDDKIHGHRTGVLHERVLQRHPACTDQEQKIAYEAERPGGTPQPLRQSDREGTGGHEGIGWRVARIKEIQKQKPEVLEEV